MAYLQVDIKTNIYMKPPTVPHNFTIPDLSQISDRFAHIYKLLNNLYGLGDTWKTWDDLLKKGLIQRDRVQQTIDGRLFTLSGMVLIMYVEDVYFISRYKHKIDAEIKSL